MNTTIREIWFKGKVKANALLTDKPSLSTTTKQVNSILLSHIEVHQTVILDKFEPNLEKKEAYLEYRELNDVKIRFKGTTHEQIAFNEDIEAIVINEVKYIQKVSIDGQTYHILEGIIYFKKAIVPIAVPKPITEEIILLKTTNKIIDYPIYNPITSVNSRSDTEWNTFFGTQKRWLGWDFLILLIFGFLTYKTILFPFFLVFGSIYLLYSLKSLFSNWSNTTNNSSVTYSSNSGCLPLFIFLALIAIAVCLYYGATDIAKVIGWIIGISILLQFLFSGSIFGNKIFKLIGSIFLLFLFILGFSHLTNNKTKQDKKNDADKVDFQDKNKIIKSGDSLIHYRDWNTLSKASLNGKYFTQYPQFNDSEKQRNSLKVEEMAAVYTKLAQKDNSLLSSYIKVFDSIRKTKKLNNIQLADAIVSSIQTIPYVLVHEGTCQDAINNSNSSFLVQYHREGKECMPNVKFGVQSGYEFLHNLKGDCDTRTLLCFELLNHYKYPVAMLISMEYGHCILGIDLPLNGLALRTENHNYLVWETTSKGFKPGELAPEISDMNKWSIAVTN
jgi:hypothetical protein